MITVYADETGTGGMLPKGKEPAPGICGLLATPETWARFRDNWRTMLAHYAVPYFHFRELNKAGRQNPKSPYYGWDDERADDFIHDMALLISTGPIPCGGHRSVTMQPEKTLAEIYGGAFQSFFEDFGTQMDEHFPDETGKAYFFFSEIKNEEWIGILNREIKSARKRDSRIGEFGFADHRDEQGIPCQAADLFAYVNRQKTADMYELGHPIPQRIIDIIISRNAYPKGHPFQELANLRDGLWIKLIQELRDDKKCRDITRSIVGDPKQQYYPCVSHSYFRGLLDKCRTNKK